jgi:hypothetical protein
LQPDDRYLILVADALILAPMKHPSRTRFDRWTRIARVALIAGGIAWLLKLVVIVATDGADSGTADAVVGMFFLLGFVLLLGGSTAVGLWLTRSRGPVLRIAAGLVAPLVFFLSMNLLDPAGEALVGDLGPDYVREEAGIFLAAVLWLTLGVLTAVLSPPAPLRRG